MTTLRQAGREVVVLDRAVYEAVHATPSPTLDHGVARVSRAADHSKIWLSIAAVMAVSGERPRRAALVGLVAVGVTSAFVNVGVKPLVRRERPSTLETVRTHVVRMPTSASYPSGHTASAFAFSTAVGGGMPELDTALRLAATTVAYSRVHTASAFAFSTAVGGGMPELDTALRLAATTVAYSRVHTGVHYPGDVVAGAVIGAGIGSLARHLARRAGVVPHRASVHGWRGHPTSRLLRALPPAAIVTFLVEPSSHRGV